MAKRVVDITEKLNFNKNPRIMVKGTELEVNTDATTVLKLMGTLGEKEEPGPKEIIGMYELMFSKSDREKIEKMKLNFTDFQTLIFSAINLITGENSQGE